MKPPKPLLQTTVLALGAVAALTFGCPAARAADHGDAPALAHDQAADLADLYVFRDPNPNEQSKVILIGTFHGFIVPGEAVNFGIFDPVIKYRFEIYNEHVNLAVADLNPKKIKPNKFIDVTFSPRVAVDGPTGKEILQVPKEQTASVQFIGFEGIDPKQKFPAPCLNPSLSATPPAQTVTTLGDTGVKFFAGECDDPFFFDIPGFARFIASVRAGTPDGTVFNRGRDTFAGYNALAIALSVPIDKLKGAGGNIIGVNLISQRHQVEQPTKAGTVKGVGSYKQVDRIATPGVNVALVPFNRKNEFNPGTPKDDATGKFAGDIVATLQALGTDQAHIDILAGVAVTYGDILRLDTTLANTGDGGGTGANGFPNGRRLRDDVIDIVLTLVANGNPFEAITLGDNVNASDVPPQNVFPFVALPQQPRDRVPNDPALPDTNVDDNTRN